MAISGQIKKLKDCEGQENRKAETKAMDNYLNSNAQAKFHREMETRRNAGMLANILREQIKQAQARKAI